MKLTKRQKKISENSINNFFNNYKGGEDVMKLTNIYCTKVPNSAYNTEPAVKDMRSEFNLD